jgi:acetyltransferase
LLDASLALSYRRPPAGTGIALLTNAGGPGAVAADALDRQGLRLVDLRGETRDRLREVCPPGAMTGNPIDMLGGAEPKHFEAALDVLLAAPEVDGVLVTFVPQALTGPPEVARAVGEAAEDVVKPVVCCIYGGGRIHEAATLLHERSVPHYLTPARAAFGLGALRRYQRIQAKERIEPQALSGVDLERARTLLDEATEQRVLDARTGAEVAAAYGLSVPRSDLVQSADEAATAAERIGYPVVLKRVAPSVVHKSDVGGVALSLEDADAVQEAFGRIVREDERAFIQRMVPEGLEVIVGAQRDPQFGPLVMFGLGGIYVEVLEDVAFRLAPLSSEDAREMVMETAAGKLMKGVRGQPRRDVEAVLEAVRRVGQLMTDFPELSEIDLNPLIVGEAGEGAWAVDVRVVRGQTS